MVGKDKFFFIYPKWHGYQFSVLGLFGILIGVEEVEINILGLNFGIDVFDMSLRLRVLGDLVSQTIGLAL